MLPFETFQVLTFDCYGTLIDWETGLWEALQPVLSRHHVRASVDQVLELFGALEAEAERGPYRPYKTVLRTVLQGLGARLGFQPDEEELQSFATSVTAWPAFADSARALQALHTRYKLAVISNVDDDLFAASAQRLQVNFDWVITAQQVQSYKPSQHNFAVALQRLGVPQAAILHVAQSLYHDIAPAKSLGLATVWVNRRHNKPGSGATPPGEAQPDVVVPDLQTLATMVGVLETLP